VRTIPTKAGTKNSVLDGSLWFQRSDHRYLGEDRIELLEKIDEFGSLGKAAKAVGVSYKTAWDTVNSINNLAESPLVQMLTGGKGGGGSSLTEEGKKVVTQFRFIQEDLRQHLATLEQRLGDTASLQQFLRRVSMKVSARNVFAGTISKITIGAVNAEVILSLKGGASLASIVTNGAVENLGLKEGQDAYAIIKASSIIIGTDLHDAKVSARNIYCGTIIKVVEGPVSSEIDVEIGGGNVVSAVITHESSQKLELKVGGHACAMFKASSVILGVN